MPDEKSVWDEDFREWRERRRVELEKHSVIESNPTWLTVQAAWRAGREKSRRKHAVVPGPPNPPRPVNRKEWA